MDESDFNKPKPDLESDDRFPSGEWVGFYLQRPRLGIRQWIDLQLTFTTGYVRGQGSDVIGKFLIRGRYVVASGRVTLHKDYIGQHHVLYSGGAEEGKGVWGVWTIGRDKGGFHIWPKGADPTQPHAVVEIEAPVDQADARATVAPVR